MHKRITRTASLCLTLLGMLSPGFAADLSTGKVLILDGANDYVEVLDNPLLRPTAQVSFEAWAYCQDWAAASLNTAILDKSDHGAGGYGLWFGGASGYISAAVRVTAPGMTYIVAQSPKSLSSGWHHFVGTFDGRYVKLYIDGVLKSTGDAGVNSSVSYPYNHVLRLGRMARENGDGVNCFGGRIDEARVYSRALLQSEVTSHYNGGNGLYGAPESGLVGGWHCDEGTGFTAADYSSNGLPGTLVNGTQWLDRTMMPNSVSGVNVHTITTTSAIVAWVSSDLAGSRVDYGTTSAYGSHTTTAPMVNTHVLTLSGLTTGTTYHFKVTSHNGTGGTATSTDATFTTLFPAPTNNEFFVSPNGSPNGNGSQGSPWDLPTALDHPADILPGAKIWLRGGVYRVPQTPGYFDSRLNGTALNPINVTRYAGEWPVIDGNLGNKLVKNSTLLQIHGDYTWFMDFEITNYDLNGRILTDIPAGGEHSNPPHRRANSVDDFAVGTKLINLIIHDTGQGIGSWIPGHNCEYYGNIVYNNGWDDDLRGHGHGTYIQNASGSKKFIDNVFFQQFGVNSRTGGTNNSAVRGLTFTGNTFFNGSMAWEGPHIENLKANNNCTYNNRFVIGYEPNSTYVNAEITDNYLMSGVLLFDFMNGAIFTGNTVWDGASWASHQGRGMTLSVTESWTPSRFTLNNNTYHQAMPVWPYWHFSIAQHPTYGPIPVNHSGDYAFNKIQGTQVQTYAYTQKSWQDDLHLDVNSTFSDAKPSGTKIFFRPNQYDSGRATVTIYNWDMTPTVSIPAASVGLVLSPGNTYQLRNTQDYFGDVITGTYAGGNLSVSMVGRGFAKPIGYDLVPAWYHDPLKATTFPEFGVFILMNTSGPNAPPPQNTPPTISAIADLSIAQDTLSSALTFTVGDVETAATNLTLFASSSNNSLAPLSHIVFGGSGANRTVMITPTANMNGVAIITVTVSDGATSRSELFILTVTPPPGVTGMPAVSSVSGTSTSTPIVVGSASPGATIRIYDNSILIHTGTADGAGSWSWTASPPLSAGVHQVTITAQVAGLSVSMLTVAITITVQGTGGTPGTSGDGGGGGGCGLGSALSGVLLALGMLLRLTAIRRRTH